MNFALFALALLVIAFQSAQGQKPADQGKILVYNDITEGSSSLNRDAKNAYPRKFRFIDIKQSDGFTPGRIKGESPYYNDPRPMREEAISGKVVIVWIVTPEGLVLEPRIVHSTDSRVANHMINRIAMRRFVPARVRGVPVFDIWVDEFVFGSDPARADSDFKDGLGIQGQRDR